MSGEGKAISPILSEADMATITPSSTNPDITDPKFQAQYRPKGKAVYFRTVTTDAYQGPNMANYLFHALKIKKRLHPGRQRGLRRGHRGQLPEAGQELGIEILGRDRLDPKEADYKTILTKIKGLNPDALYYGGVSRRRPSSPRQALRGDAEGHQARAPTASTTSPCRSSRARRPSRAGSARTPRRSW